MDTLSVSKSIVNQDDLRKAQLKMVDILSEIDRICKKHDIKWCIFYGTLLGAIRHKGFIPWDDDCDIIMMRDDYDRFIEVAPKELGEQFFLQTKKTDPYYSKKVTKIRLNGTTLVEVDERIGERYHQGVFVDIFVWDYYPAYSKKLLEWFQIMPNLRQKRKIYPKGSWRRLLVGIMTAIPYFFHSLLEKTFIIIWNSTKRNSNLKYVTTEMCLCDGNLFKFTDIFPLKREYDFEGNVFPTPNNSDICLTTIYGNYMELPPVEKRYFHAKMIKAD